ncbi:HtaA domain-containing protein (plasmid) [Rhodococcus erythropolis]|uniref:HtaA domain-containing protein n=1 Tax=Rhodococcus erythropolis TaxID=1833 RepID=UPI00406BA983
MTAAPFPPGFPQVGFTWGIKRSFIRYISYLPDGDHVGEDGAYLNEASLFTYPRSHSSGAGAGELRFRGTVRIGGHGGLLGVLLSEPWIRLSGDRGTLSVVDPSQWPSREGRINLAELECERQPIDTGLVLRCAASLAEEGVSVFGGNYSQGTPLDPVVIR